MLVAVVQLKVISKYECNFSKKNVTKKQFCVQCVLSIMNVGK